MKISTILAASLLAIITVTGCGSKEETTTTDGGGGGNTTFGAPANFTASPRDQGAYLRFDRNSAAGYKLYFGTTADMTGLGSTFLASPMTLSANSLTVGDLTNGTTYYFAVSAVDSSGVESAKSQVVTVVPAAPVTQ